MLETYRRTTLIRGYFSMRELSQWCKTSVLPTVALNEYQELVRLSDIQASSTHYWQIFSSLHQSALQRERTLLLQAAARLVAFFFARRITRLPPKESKTSKRGYQDIQTSFTHYWQIISHPTQSALQAAACLVASFSARRIMKLPPKESNTLKNFRHSG